MFNIRCSETGLWTPEVVPWPQEVLLDEGGDVLLRAVARLQNLHHGDGGVAGLEAGHAAEGQYRVEPVQLLHGHPVLVVSLYQPLGGVYIIYFCTGSDNLRKVKIPKIYNYFKWSVLGSTLVFTSFLQDCQLTG